MLKQSGSIGLFTSNMSLSFSKLKEIG